MKIGPVDSGDRPLRPNEEEKRRADVNSDSQQRMNQTDKVEISSVARSMSEKTSTSSDEIGGTASTDRVDLSREAPDVENRRDQIEQARERIESGYYDSPEVKDDIARRITDDFLG